LLLLGSLCSYKTGVRISCLEGGPSIVGILPGKEFPSSFLLAKPYIRAIRGLEGLGNYSYLVAIGYFSPSNPLEGLWLLDRVKEVKGVAIRATYSIARECVTPRSYINNIFKLEAIA
jgi:hypothetical protein